MGKINRKVIRRMVDALRRTQGYTREEAAEVGRRLDAIPDSEYEALAASCKGQGPAAVQGIITQWVSERYILDIE